MVRGVRGPRKFLPIEDGGGPGRNHPPGMTGFFQTDAERMAFAKRGGRK